MYLAYLLSVCVLRVCCVCVARVVLLVKYSCHGDMHLRISHFISTPHTITSQIIKRQLTKESSVRKREAAELAVHQQQELYIAKKLVRTHFRRVVRVLRAHVLSGSGVCLRVGLWCSHLAVCMADVIHSNAGSSSPLRSRFLLKHTPHPWRHLLTNTHVHTHLRASASAPAPAPATTQCIHTHTVCTSTSAG